MGRTGTRSRFQAIDPALDQVCITLPLGKPGDCRSVLEMTFRMLGDGYTRAASEAQIGFLGGQMGGSREMNYLPFSCCFRDEGFHYLMLQKLIWAVGP